MAACHAKAQRRKEKFLPSLRLPLRLCAFAWLNSVKREELDVSFSASNRRLDHINNLKAQRTRRLIHLKLFIRT